VPEVRVGGGEVKKNSQLDLFALPAPIIFVPPSSSGILSLLQPISDETGGPLNAIESERVVTRRSIRFAGYQYTNGSISCRAHRDHRPDGAGFRMTIYSGTSKDEVVGRCCVCDSQVVGESP